MLHGRECKVMAVADGWIMARAPRAAPFLITVKSFRALAAQEVSDANAEAP
ncbi:hypothetical protein [Deinococcus hopiensis]|uniref:Uncharacterized protein n=1 Tax=Deinococcus hopiensis KR-140 TaxID=695939 RepID=A0A1W1VIK2_9DEIO|nr:hypothetical protein [Deinococcus hopiensis]SMB93156.1 hypothetical protein SAMN00790413_01869 [Deinococcus hopiensis KR-140]